MLDTHIKAYDITKVTAELKSDNRQYRKIYYFVGCFGVGGSRHRKHCHICRTMIVGRRQLTVRFMRQLV